MGYNQQHIIFFITIIIENNCTNAAMQAYKDDHSYSYPKYLLAFSSIVTFSCRFLLLLLMGASKNYVF
ncbi:MAG TPA: hypothetical protein PK772_04485, partial [Chitinophagaceae bacterium]|nr:hypothetical protein [Chitinophagaceae bacterium]